MLAGKLDRRITIQGRSVTQSDSGQEVVTWTDVATVWAESVTLRGIERFSVQQIVGHAIMTFRIRWSTTVSAVTTKHRLSFDGRVFDITDVREPKRREFLEIDCYAPSEQPVAA